VNARACVWLGFAFFHFGVRINSGKCALLRNRAACQESRLKFPSDPAASRLAAGFKSWANDRGEYEWAGKVIVLVVVRLERNLANLVGVAVIQRFTHLRFDQARD